MSVAECTHATCARRAPSYSQAIRRAASRDIRCRRRILSAADATGRNTLTIRASIAHSRRDSINTGSSRHSRGSFTHHRCAALARRRRCPTYCDLTRAGTPTGAHGSRQPPRPSIRSCIRHSVASSKCPRGFDADPPISSPASAAGKPSRESTPATLLVPHRCPPNTITTPITSPTTQQPAGLLPTTIHRSCARPPNRKCKCARSLSSPPLTTHQTPNHHHRTPHPHLI